MAFDFVAQRLEIGDVVLIRRPDEEGEVEATVVREIDRTDTAVGDGAAQDRRIQHIAAREIVDIFPASAQKTQILEPFDRAANERVDGSHLRSPPRSLARAFGLYAARASSTASTMGI